MLWTEQAEHMKPTMVHPTLCLVEVRVGIKDMLEAAGGWGAETSHSGPRLCMGLFTLPLSVAAAWGAGPELRMWLQHWNYVVRKNRSRDIQADFYTDEDTTSKIKFLQNEHACSLFSCLYLR